MGLEWFSAARPLKRARTELNATWRARADRIISLCAEESGGKCVGCTVTRKNITELSTGKARQRKRR